LQVVGVVVECLPMVTVQEVVEQVVS
jgi:hypothetical protein